MARAACGRCRFIKRVAASAIGPSLPTAGAADEVDCIGHDENRKLRQPDGTSLIRTELSGRLTAGGADAEDSHAL